MTDEQLLDKVGVAAILGWSSPNHVDVNQHRTRAGRAAVPFPAPVNPDAPVADHRWRREVVDAWKAARSRTGGRHLKLTPDLAKKIKELHGDNVSLDEIAEQAGVSRSTAWRVATGRRTVDQPKTPRPKKAPRPKRAPRPNLTGTKPVREKPIDDAEMALLLGKNPPRKKSA